MRKSLEQAIDQGADKEINDYYREVLELIEKAYLKSGLRVQEKAALMRTVKQYVKGPKDIHRTIGEVIEIFFKSEFEIILGKYYGRPDELLAAVLSKRDENYGYKPSQ